MPNLSPNPLMLSFFYRTATLCILLVWAIPSQATHIVGGDISLEYLGSSRYLLSLNLFNDDINGNPEAIDQDITLGIYEKGSPNRLIQSVVLSEPERSTIPYPNEACATGNLQTSKFVYSEVIRLLPSTFSNPEGYFIAWQRCCRNNIIKNIYNPEATGMTFYMEFPPIVDQFGARFINNSPEFNPVQGDYACLGRTFTYDFSATDADGDELRYRIVHPWQGNVDENNPALPPLSGFASDAYRNEVLFFPGYSAEQPIPSVPPINIDEEKGQLSFNATETGLFVFAVEVREFREGEQIGLVRREFQVLVLDCPEYSPPVAVAFDNQEEPAQYQQGDTITIIGQTKECAQLRVSDPDVDDFITVTAIPVNYTPTSQIVTPRSARLSSEEQVAKFEICAPDCRFSEEDEVYIIDVVVADNACPRPNTDTIRYIFQVLQPPNQRPERPEILNYPSNDLFVEAGLEESISFDILVEDPDTADVVRLEYYSPDTDLGALGISLADSFVGNPSIVNFDWETTCRSIAQAGGDSLITIQLVAWDDRCEQKFSDTSEIVIKVSDRASTFNVFDPYNVVTPNGDGYNDVWQMPNLPINNCEGGSYVGVEIYNRYGVQLFRSEDRNFSWDPNSTAGTYFWRIIYTKKEYKGWLEVLR